MFKSTIACAAFTILAGCLATAAIGQSIEDLDEERNARASDSSATPNLTRAAKRIIRLTNEFRQEEDREEVAPQDELMETARQFARFMAENDKYGHTADGRRPSERASEQGYAYCIVGENIAYQFSERGFEGPELARRFVDGWKNSPEHRKNMLDGDMTQTGVAVARSDSNGAYYAVQMFGRPESARITLEVANRSGQTVEYTIKGRDHDRTFSLPPRATRTHERCRPGKLATTFDGQTKEVSYEDGDRYVIRRQNDRLVLTKE
jgi:uncharacterized protein YkwD